MATMKVLLTNQDKVFNGFIDMCKASKLDNKVIRLKMVKVLTSVLGETGAYAVIHVMGEASLDKPEWFAEAIQRTFGFGGQIIMTRLVAELWNPVST